jgi:transposase
MCPTCGKPSPRHDHRKRRWRHLPTCQYHTIIEVDVPRVRCEEHGVKQVPVPWAESNSSFTALFEALVISWLKEASVAAVAERMELSWDQVDGIMQRAVRRGLARRGPVEPKHIGVDETSFQKRHEYVTVVNDLDGERVVHVADGRGQSALEAFYEGLTPEARAGIEAVAMDMWKPYIYATAIHVPEAERRIAFDRFHVVKHLTDAVDKVRRQENRQLVSAGDERLKRSKYLWLHRPHNLNGNQRLRFRDLKESSLKTARAWALKEAAIGIWGYKVRGWAQRAWDSWLDWASRSRLEPMVKVAKMIRYHLIGILNADVLNVTNRSVGAQHFREVGHPP